VKQVEKQLKRHIILQTDNLTSSEDVEKHSPWNFP
jgi:hypothetical protein